MSGIAGVFSLDSNEAVLDRLLGTMKHRGKGHSQCHVWDDHALLQVGDTGTAGEMEELVSLEWAGERYTIVFDGVIFNRQQVIQELSNRHHPLPTVSDAWCMLQGYLCWGEEFLNHINGVFAVAIVHEKQGKLFLARDRMGVRPLFYMPRGKGLLFASEIKTILSHPAAEAQLDAYGIGELLLLGPGRTPGSGVFRDIYEILPGNYGVFQGGNLQLHQYWKLSDRLHQDSFDDTVEQVRHLVIDSIRCQLPVDRKAGTMLSGGLDSSVVSAICAREMDAEGKVLDTFSLDYRNNDQYFVPGRFQPNMDTEYIRVMLAEMDSNHHWTVLDPSDLVDEICNATIARDLPGMADIDASLLAFCRQIRPHTRTVLSGECADEIFGGYPWYRDPDLRDYDGFPWAQTIEQRKDFLPEWVTASLDPEEFVRQRYIHALRQADIRPDNDARERRMKELTHMNIHWFMQTLLERSDRMGAMAGVEIRVPFCDYRIAEYLYSVPWHYKDYKGVEKGLLRRAMEGVLPNSVLYRKKSPFPKTHDPAYLQIVSQLLESLLQDSSAPIFRIVRREALENLLHQDFPFPWYGQLMRRPQTIVYMLQINYWMAHYSVRIV